MNPAREIFAASARPRETVSNYPEPFHERFRGRIKRPLAAHFGINDFGVNLTTLAPGAHSSLQHRHSHEDEFIYVLEGELTLLTETSETILRPGVCVGFPAGGTSHHLENRSLSAATYLEIGSRNPADTVSYPQDDLFAIANGNSWCFFRKNGDPY